jgi:maltose alpha-D-glucosyltransferase / alpha-amylase
MRSAQRIVLSASWQELMKIPHAISVLQDEVIPDFLKGVRWFSGKARPIEKTRIRFFIPFPCQHTLAYFLIVETIYTDQTSELYSVPVMLVNEQEAERIIKQFPSALICQISDATSGNWVVDAIYSEEFRNTLFTKIAESNSLNYQEGQLDFHGSDLLSAHAGKQVITSKVLNAEQSNSSIIFNERFFFKLFRKVDWGINPDFEIIRYLSEKTLFTDIPEYAGAFEFVSSEKQMLLGLMQKKVENKGDAWSYSLNKLTALIGAKRYDIIKGKNSTDDVLPSDLKDLFSLLGERTAAMHQAMASGTKENGFDIEFWDENSVNELSTKLIKLLEGLKQLPIYINDKQNFKAFYHQHIEAIRQWVECNSGLLINYPVIRIHGDYHLGQVLITDKGICILDFEGEPGIGLGLRRKKIPGLKDVAGMLRSFSYAAYASLYHEIKLTEREQYDFQKLADAITAEASELFLKYYSANVEYIHAPHSMLCLELFMLEKALYEINYESNNRIDWVEIPLQGLKKWISKNLS